MKKTKREYSEKEKILALCYDDIDTFARIFLSTYKTRETPDFHIEIERTLKDENNKRVEIIAPRGHAKSTVVSFIYAMWNICFKRKKFIVLISDSWEQSKAFLEMIKSQFETNEMLKYYFGNLIGDKKWNEGEIITENDIKILCLGTGMKLRGLRYKETRPDLIICDDIQNDELVSSENRRKKLKYWFNAVVMPSLNHDGQLVLIGTTLHYDDLLCEVKKKDLYPEFLTLEYKAIKENNQPLWPDMFSMEKLETIKKQYIARGMKYVFDREYMNNPVSDEDRLFRMTGMQYFTYADIPPNKKLDVFITFDRAYSKGEKSDFTGIAVVGIDKDDNWYVLHSENYRGNDDEIIGKYFQLAQFVENLKFNLVVSGFEQKGFMNTLYLGLKKRMTEKKKYYNIIELKDGGTPKEMRIQGIQPIYNAGKIFFQRDQTSLINNLIDFPRSVHDDDIDALAYVLQLRGVKKQYQILST